MISLNIGHIHKLTEETEYRELGSKYRGIIIHKSTCACGFYEEKPGGGWSKSSNEACELIAKVALELGRPSPFLTIDENGVYHPSGYGSGWIAEMPAVISQLLDSYGEAYARQQVVAAFMAGDAGVVTRPVLGY